MFCLPWCCPGCWSLACCGAVVCVVWWVRWWGIGMSNRTRRGEHQHEGGVGGHGRWSLPFFIDSHPTPLTCYPQRRNPHINTQTHINQASKILQRRFPSSRKQVRTARFPSCCSSMGGASTTPLPHTARMCACTRVIHRVLCSYPAVLGMRGLLFPAPKMTQTRRTSSPSSSTLPPPRFPPRHSTHTRTARARRASVCASPSSGRA